MSLELTDEAMNHLNSLPLGNAIKRYIEQKKSIHGDFLTAIVEGDLFKASRHADLTNKPLIAQYSLFFSYYAPVDSYGSFEKKLKWLGIEENTSNYKKIKDKKFQITWTAEDAFSLEESHPLPNSLVIKAMDALFLNMDHNEGLSWIDIRLTLENELRNLTGSKEEYAPFLPTSRESLELMHHTIETERGGNTGIYNVWLRESYESSDGGFTNVEEFDREFENKTESIKYAETLARIFSLEIEFY